MTDTIKQYTLNLTQQFKSFIKQHGMFGDNDRVLLAVSGGVDSVVMCELFKQSGYDFAIAHCNFQLRGEESDGDELFVKSLAENYGVEFFINRVDTQHYIHERKVNIQIAARELRYKWFNDILEGQKQRKITTIATAHHLNDNIETLMMNFFKGTGIRGLKGMSPSESGIGGKIIRPLLFATREMILDFAKENQLQWREDSSNDTVKYTRNFLRHEIIPKLKSIYPEIEKNMQANLERFNDASQLYNESVERFRSKHIKSEGDEIFLPVLLLQRSATSKTLLYEILNPFGFSSNQMPEVHKLLFSESGKHVASASHRIFRNRKWLVVSPMKSLSATHFFIEENDTFLEFDKFRIEISHLSNPVKISADPNVAMIDASLVKFPLMVRKWKQGDYFYPLGMNKKKKLSRFFIDQKLSVTEKENCIVLESDKRIIWIAGHRIDNRFRINDSTKDVVRLVLSPSE